jgi:hypothetical protein
MRDDSAGISLRGNLAWVAALFHFVFSEVVGVRTFGLCGRVEVAAVGECGAGIQCEHPDEKERESSFHNDMGANASRRVNPRSFGGAELRWRAGVFSCGEKYCPAADGK